MPVGSIPPVERGLAKGRVSSGLRTAARASASTAVGSSVGSTVRLRENARPRTSNIRPANRVVSTPASPVINDVKVTKTPNAITWDFPYGEFQVMIGNSEVHIEVKIGCFVDALILEFKDGERTP